MIDILLLLLIIYIISLLPNRSDDSLAFDHTLCLRGLLCIFVVLHHTFQQTATGHFFNYLIFMGRYAVATFFFLSGYSLCTQVSKNPNYLQHFLRKRLGKILLPYGVIAVVYIVFWKITYDPNYSLTDVVSHFPKYDTVISNGWFMISIFVFYVFFYISFRLCKKRAAAILLCCGLVLAYTLLLQDGGYGFHWYNANLAFPLGLIWACHKHTIDALISKHLSLLLPLATVFLFFWHQYPLFEHDLRLPFRLPDLWYTNLSSIGFVILLLLLLQKIELRSRLFRFFGSISMEVYLLHGLFIYLFQNHAQSNLRDLLFALLVLGCSTFCALIFHHLFRQLNRLIYR